MAIIDDLIAQINDPELRNRISKEVGKLTSKKKFGLVYEEHIPECTPLYDVKVKKGSTIALKSGKINDLYTVKSISSGEVVASHRVDGTETTFNIDDVVAVAQFGEPIYPYLKPIDSVKNDPDGDLWHTLIEADNYHALQLLAYLYPHQVDCIYIDPPYNTGARDWKYNNDFVDSNDAYRHSKWLSFMEKRLRLAKQLLNPQTGVLIIAIDDNELNTLGLLLSEVFEGYKKFCVTVVHNPNGNQGKNFGITNEFLYYLLPSGDQLLSLENRTDDPDIRPLRDVSGNSNLRTDAKNCFYPIYIKNDEIIGFGEVCDDNFHPISANVKQNDGTIAVYPIDAQGIEKKWVFARNTVESILSELHVEWNSSREIFDIIRHKTHFTYKSVWTKKEYNANSNGSKLITKIFGEKRFDYPKSLYAVEECIRSVCGDRKNALIVDFFSGSGTTLHAVNLLNAEDGGHRKCIMITNNEVSDKESKVLTKQGYKPGDEEWEKLGIARYVTWPRTVCSIEGHDVNGKELKGNYLGSDLPMADGFKANAAYFKLGFLSKENVSLGRQFRELLPLLWLKAGSHHECPKLKQGAIPDMLIYPENKFAVLVNEASYPQFEKEVNSHKEIETVYIITDSQAGYREMIKGLSVNATYQLYRDYLDNFRINTGR